MAPVTSCGCCVQFPLPLANECVWMRLPWILYNYHMHLICVVAMGTKHHQRHPVAVVFLMCCNVDILSPLVYTSPHFTSSSSSPTSPSSRHSLADPRQEFRDAVWKHFKNAPRIISSSAAPPRSGHSTHVATSGSSVSRRITRLSQYPLPAFDNIL